MTGGASARRPRRAARRALRQAGHDAALYPPELAPAMSGERAILPDGVRVGAGVDLAERPVVRVDIAAGTLKAALVVTPREARALASLLLRQADLVEGRAGFLPRIVGGREG